MSNIPAQNLEEHMAKQGEELREEIAMALSYPRARDWFDGARERPHQRHRDVPALPGEITRPAYCMPTRRRFGAWSSTARARWLAHTEFPTRCRCTARYIATGRTLRRWSTYTHTTSCCAVWPVWSSAPSSGGISPRRCGSRSRASPSTIGSPRRLRRASWLKRCVTPWATAT